MVEPSEFAAVAPPPQQSSGRIVEEGAELHYIIPPCISSPRAISSDFATTLAAESQSLDKADTAAVDEVTVANMPLSSKVAAAESAQEAAKASPGHCAVTIDHHGEHYTCSVDSPQLVDHPRRRKAGSARSTPAPGDEAGGGDAGGLILLGKP